MRVQTLCRMAVRWVDLTEQFGNRAVTKAMEAIIHGIGIRFDDTESDHHPLRAVAVALVVAAMTIPRVVRNLRDVFAPKSYDWVSRTMSACEEDAVTKPTTLNFLVMPLEPSRRYGHGLEARALENRWDARLCLARRTPSRA